MENGVWFEVRRRCELLCTVVIHLVALGMVLSRGILSIHTDASFRCFLQFMFDGYVLPKSL